MNVPDVGGGFDPTPLSEQGHQLGVLSDGSQLPLLDEPLQAGKVVKPLLQKRHRPFQVVVPGLAEEDIVKGQVLLVVEVEVVDLDGRLHFVVQTVHIPYLRLAETAEGREESGALQGADDFVDVADVLLRQDVDHDLAAGQDGDESQLQEGVAKRRLADAQTRGGLLHVDGRAGAQASRPHLLPQVLVDLLLQRLDIEDGFGVRHCAPPKGFPRPWIDRPSISEAAGGFNLPCGDEGGKALGRSRRLWDNTPATRSPR
jgi:hypothetical protein